MQVECGCVHDIAGYAGSEPDWVGEAAASGYHAASFIGYSLQQPGEPSIYVAYNPYDYPMRIDIPDPPSGDSFFLLHWCLGYD